MNTAAMYHRAVAPWAFPLDETTLEITVACARGDAASVTAVHGDRYSPENTETPLTCEGTDGERDYWRAAVPFPLRRPRYTLRFERAGETLWLGPYGPSPAPKLIPFEYAYIHASTVPRPPAWLDDAVFYQVFPDRFRNGDPANDPPGTAPWGTPPERRTVCGGDLEGMRQAAGYLRDLGISAVYTTPVCQARTNHKYDTEDYERVDPAFGTNADLAALSAEYRAAGIRLVLDGVFNHAGSSWWAFRDVIANGEASPYRNWFHGLRFPVDPDVPNYETFATGVGTMPKLNPADPGLSSYLLGVAERWTRDCGISGWRLDVGNEVEPAFWRAFRERIRSVEPDAFILVEAWPDAMDGLCGGWWDGATNYPWRAAVLAFLKGKTDATQFLNAVTRVRMMYPSIASNACMNLLGSHDTPRIRTVLGSVERVVLGAALMFTSPGIPLVYYGDEAGLEGGDDPDCRRCFPWDDPSLRDSRIALAFGGLIAMRRANPWLRRCRWVPRPENAGPLCAYTAVGPDGQRLEVAVNNGDEVRALSLPGRWEDALTGERGEVAALVAAVSFRILRQLPA